jgi:hypothetical protein
VDEGTPKEVVGGSNKAIKTLAEWEEFYTKMRDSLRDTRRDLRTKEEGFGKNAYDVIDTNFAKTTGRLADTYDDSLRFLDILDAIVRKQIEDQPLLDFVKLLKKAHDNEEAINRSLV